MRKIYMCIAWIFLATVTVTGQSQDVGEKYIKKGLQGIWLTPADQYSGSTQRKLNLNQYEVNNAVWSVMDNQFDLIFAPRMNNDTLELRFLGANFGMLGIERYGWVSLPKNDEVFAKCYLSKNKRALLIVYMDHKLRDQINKHSNVFGAVMVPWDNK